jgi:hypothetical protein
VKNILYKFLPSIWKKILPRPTLPSLPGKKDNNNNNKRKVFVLKSIMTYFPLIEYSLAHLEK